jgi:hypothetical protein
LAIRCSPTVSLDLRGSTALDPSTDEGLDMDVIVLVVIITALVFDFTNGFHDTSQRHGDVDRRLRPVPDHRQVAVRYDSRPHTGSTDGGKRMLGALEVPGPGVVVNALDELTSRP